MYTTKQYNIKILMGLNYQCLHDNFSFDMKNNSAIYFCYSLSSSLSLSLHYFVVLLICLVTKSERSLILFLAKTQFKCFSIVSNNNYINII